MEIKTLNKYLAEGLLYNQVHPTLPLIIWNYTDKVQWERLWDEVTLTCRALVTDTDGNVVARSFRKFFNLSEGMHTETDSFEVYDKMDGSLGLAFFYAGDWRFASRGSFTSEQSIRGEQMFRRADLSVLDRNLCYSFEIIYPENRIVCDYGGKEELVFLAAFDKEGREHEVSVPFIFAAKRDHKDLHALAKLNLPNEEGFVVKFSNGDRCKVKFEEYVKLHRIMTGVSTTSVWECLKSGEDLEKIIEGTPDEFYDKVREYAQSMKGVFVAVETTAKQIHKLKSHLGKKEYAEYVQQNFGKSYQVILFNLYNGKSYDEAIWRLLKPKFERL